MGESVLDRVLKRCMWAEMIFGAAVIAAGLFFGGPLLPALGSCMIALAAVCSVHSNRYRWAGLSLGLLSILLLSVSAIMAFSYTTSLSGYADNSSPLTVLFLLALVLLCQSFLSLPLEDRDDLSFLRRGIKAMAVFSGLGFGAIILTYLLSYILFNVLVSVLDAEAVVESVIQDFHYLEGVLALAMAFTGGREVFRAFLGKEHPAKEPQEEYHDQTA